MRSDRLLSSLFAAASLLFVCTCASTPTEVNPSRSTTTTTSTATVEAARLTPPPRSAAATPSTAPSPPPAAACAAGDASEVPSAPSLEPHAIALELVDREGTESGRPMQRLSPATMAEFPALSEDGRWLALAANDEADFSADVVVRLRIVALPSGHTLATHVLEDESAAYDAKTPREVAAYERATTNARVKAQAELDQKRWVGLERAYVPAETSCVAGPWTLFDASRTLDVDRVRRFERAALELELTPSEHLTVRTAKGGRVDARTMSVSFPAMGRASEGGECGGVIGLRDAWISGDHRTLVLTPHPSLGGDNCVGHLGLDQTIVTRL